MPNSGHCVLLDKERPRNFSTYTGFLENVLQPFENKNYHQLIGSAAITDKLLRYTSNIHPEVQFLSSRPLRWYDTLTINAYFFCLTTLSQTMNAATDHSFTGAAICGLAVKGILRERRLGH